MDSCVRSQEDDQDVSQAGDNEGCGVIRDSKKSDDHGVDDKARRPRDDRVTNHPIVTPSMGSAVNRQTDKT